MRTNVYFFLQRIKLFNAYAMKKLCEAGIPVLDVYHISAAYPHGTIDGIHYPHFVFYPAEDALEKYFTTWLPLSRPISDLECVACTTSLEEVTINHNSLNASTSFPVLFS